MYTFIYMRIIYRELYIYIYKWVSGWYSNPRPCRFNLSYNIFLPPFFHDALYRKSPGMSNDWRDNEKKTISDYSFA